MKDFITKANLSGGDDSGTATKWGAKESNSVTDELKLAVTATGQSLAAGTGNDPSPDLLAKSLTITAQTAHSYQDSGASDAYVLTRTGSLEQPDSYIEGMRITFITANQNTGASTVNVSSLGVKAIVKAGDIALSSGDISEDTYMELIYDPAADSAAGGFVLTSLPIVKVSYFTSSGTHTTTKGVKSIEIIATGGGGGGGGVDGQGAGTAAASNPGAAGATAILTTNSPSSLTITIGAGGTGGLAGNNDGITGGTTTVVGTGVNISAGGGQRGRGDIGISISAVFSGETGGIASGGQINLGGQGSTGSAVVSGDPCSSGLAGSSFWGGSAPGRLGGDGHDATAPGSGGGCSTVHDITDNYAGGDGGDGIVIIKEYF